MVRTGICDGLIAASGPGGLDGSEQILDPRESGPQGERAGQCATVGHLEGAAGPPTKVLPIFVDLQNSQCVCFRHDVRALADGLGPAVTC